MNPFDNFLIQASRLFFGLRDVAGMFATLEPLHAMLDKGPQTGLGFVLPRDQENFTSVSSNMFYPSYSCAVT